MSAERLFTMLLQAIGTAQRELESPCGYDSNGAEAAQLSRYRAWRELEACLAEWERVTGTFLDSTGRLSPSEPRLTLVK